MSELSPMQAAQQTRMELTDVLITRELTEEELEAYKSAGDLIIKLAEQNEA